MGSWLPNWQAAECHIGQFFLQTRDIDPKLFQCWASIAADGLTLKPHWINVPCLLGRFLLRPVNN